MIDDEAGILQLGGIMSLGADAVLRFTKIRLRLLALRPMMK